MGCGDFKTKGYIGIDLEPKIDLDIIADAQRIPIRTNIIKRIFTDQMMEHLPNPPMFLEDCNRVLKLNGILIISVPNTSTLRRTLRWMLKNEVTVWRDHIYSWGLPELRNLVTRYGFKYVLHDVRTHERHHKLKWYEKMLRSINKRAVDKNLIMRFEKWE